MLKYLTDKNDFKNQASVKFREVLVLNSDFQHFIWELLVYGKIYIVGGFLRDIINERPSRDIDMIIDLPPNTIEDLLKKSTLSFKFNRMNGVKIKLNDFEVDLWSIDNNWAFKNDLVKKNEDYILSGIANGCFYNYDSIVLNVNSREFHASNYNNCAKSKTLDIIQKNIFYKKKNPTIEANILRAFYLQREFGLNFSENCHTYLFAMLNFLKDKYKNVIDHLEAYKFKYEKYENYYTKQELSNLVIKTISDFEILYVKGKKDGQSKLLL